jgi:hypothetical protein
MFLKKKKEKKKRKKVVSIKIKQNNNLQLILKKIKSSTQITKFVTNFFKAIFCLGWVNRVAGVSC